MTILEVINRSTEFLKKKEVDSPRLQVELLLAHALKMPRMKLYLNFERGLSAEELETLRSLVQRRGQREPLQHILGTTSFCGLEITVNSSVLIPRPETELLAERAWRFLGNKEAHALDLCTGSGCLAIAMAVKAPQARIVASDISPAALAVARENSVNNGVANRVTFIESDGFQALESKPPFDLIISNPPYIPTGDIDALETEVRDYDPRLALDGGADGMDFYRRIAGEAGAFLKHGGYLMLELNDNGGAAVSQLFNGPEWVIDAVEKDLNQIERIFIAHRA